MMCGTDAHGRILDALRNGGCGYQFDWNSLRGVDGGYIDEKGNQAQGQPTLGRPRQKLLHRK